MHLTTTSSTSTAQEKAGVPKKLQHRVTIDYGIMYRPCALQQANGSGSIILHDMMDTALGNERTTKPMHKAVWMWLPLEYYASTEQIYSYFDSYKSINSAGSCGLHETFKRLVEMVKLKSRKKLDAYAFANQLDASLKQIQQVNDPLLNNG